MKGFTAAHFMAPIIVENDNPEVQYYLGPDYLFGAQESASSYYYESWVVNLAGQIDHHQKPKKRGYKVEPSSVSGDVVWAGMEDQYFAALLVPREQPARLDLTPMSLARQPVAEDEEPPEAMTEVVLAVSVPPAGADLFVGPKQHDLLEKFKAAHPEMDFSNAKINYGGGGGGMFG